MTGCISRLHGVSTGWLWGGRRPVPPCSAGQGSRPPAVSMNISLLTIVCFASYVSVYVYVCGAHLLAFRRHKENLWLSIRVPDMLVAEVIINILLGVSTALRQILAESSFGYYMPCYVINIVSCLGVTVFPYTHIYRTVKAIVVIKHQWRKRYMRFFHARAARFHLVVMTVIAGLTWIADSYADSCRSICNKPNCMLLSNYFVLLPLTAIVIATYLGLIAFIYVYKIKDATGCVEELLQTLVVMVLFITPYSGIVLAMDWGVVGDYKWERLATGLILSADALFLYFGVMAPAVKYGYDPFSRKRAEYTLPDNDLPGEVELGRGGRVIARMLHIGATVAPAQSTKTLSASSRSMSMGVSTQSIQHNTDQEVEFDDMLCTPEVRDAFLAYCSQQLCYEHIMFIIDMEELARQPTGTREEREQRRQRLLEIGERYFRFGSTMDLGLNYRIASAVLRQLTLFQRRKVVFVDEFKTYMNVLLLVERKIRNKLIYTVFTQFRTTPAARPILLHDHDSTSRLAGSSGGRSSGSGSLQLTASGGMTQDPVMPFHSMESGTMGDTIGSDDALLGRAAGAGGSSSGSSSPARVKKGLTAAWLMPPEQQDAPTSPTPVAAPGEGARTRSPMFDPESAVEDDLIHSLKEQEGEQPSPKRKKGGVQFSS